MLRPSLLAAGLAALLLAGAAFAQSATPDVAEVIAARRGLMTQLTTLQSLIDVRVASGAFAPELHELAQATAASLDAFALLLPPETNLLGGAPAVDGAETTAAATIWEDLPAFQKLLRDAAASARTASEELDLASFQAQWDKVAQSCTSCHTDHVVYDPFAATN